MGGGSVTRPIAIYAIVFMSALAFVLLMEASLAIVGTARSGAFDLAQREAVHLSQRQDFQDLRAGLTSLQHRGDPVGLVDGFGSAFGVDLVEARMQSRQADSTRDFAAARLPSGSEAYVVVLIDGARVLALARPPMRRLVGISAVAALVLGLSMSVMIARLVLKPLAVLERAAAEGHASGELELSEGPNEITSVARTYRRTLRALEEDRASLERKNNELERMQQQLIRASKLASVGRLAAGVAHEIGNPLAAVLGYMSLLRRGLSPEEQADVVERSATQLKRINETIKKLLVYARHDEPNEERQAFSTTTAIRDATTLLKGHPSLRGIEIEELLEPAPDLDALGQERALGQALVNLIVNAGQALGATSGARIVVRRTLTPNSVELEIEDNGPGIPDELLEHVFDPFFTTKAQGEGTGLGLAISRSLIEAMDGALEAERGPSGGALFRISLHRVAVTQDRGNMPTS